MVIRTVRCEVLGTSHSNGSNVIMRDSKNMRFQVGTSHSGDSDMRMRDSKCEAPGTSHYGDNYMKMRHSKR